MGKLGRGPGEYLRPLDRFYNRYDKKIYAIAENSIITYNLEGVFLDSFERLKVKESSVKDGYIRASLEAYLNIDTCIFYLNNSTGSMSKRIIIATKNNEIKSFPHYEKWPSSEVFQIIKIQFSFHGGIKCPLKKGQMIQFSLFQ